MLGDDRFAGVRHVLLSDVFGFVLVAGDGNVVRMLLIFGAIGAVGNRDCVNCVSVR